jgi:putative FmdB family regulatory protein
LPIYTYECHSCGSTLERRQSFSDDPLTTHDECGGGLRRVIHPAGIVFKGSGFYNTDYKNGTSSAKSESEPAKAEATASNGTKSDSASGESGSTAAASTSSSANGGESSSSSKSESKSSTPAATTS